MSKDPAHIVSIDIRKYDDNPHLSLVFYTTFQFCDGVSRVDLPLSINEVEKMLKTLDLSKPSQLIGRHVDVVDCGGGNLFAENIR